MVAPGISGRPVLLSRLIPLEETHELLDAIERNDTENLKEELGDLLFNIVFHARIAEEQGLFKFDDIGYGIVRKMRRRHPNVSDT